MGHIRRFISNVINKGEETFFSLFSKKSSVVINDVDFGHILEGKAALITGGSSGIGLAIAKKMISCGASVTIVGRDPEKTQKVAQEISCDYLLLDLIDTKGLISKVTEYVKDRNIDILVNSAGVLDKEPWLAKTPDGFDRVIATNLKAAYFMSQTIAKHMIEKKISGHILNVSSSSSMRPSWGPYQLSKRALNGMTLGFAQKLAPQGITVNALAPGVTLTPMAANFMDTSNLAYYNPLRRAETPKILSIWLGVVPDYAVAFVRLTFVSSMVTVLGNTLVTAQLATGKIRKYQIVMTLVGFWVFPLTWVAYKLGGGPEWTYYIFCAVYFALIFVRIYLVKDLIHMPWMMYVREVILKGLLVLAIAVVAPLLVYLTMPDSILRVVLVVLLSFISSGIVIYWIGLHTDERQSVKRLILEKALHR